MATKRQRSNGLWEYCFQRKELLGRRVYLTFETEREGDAFERVAEEALARGVVPPELAQQGFDTLQALFDAYELSGASTKSDVEMFRTVGPKIGATKVKSVNYGWVEEWVAELVKTYSPSTTKKRVEFLGRAIAWGMRREKVAFLNNPVQQLPKGYATKNVPKERLWAGQRDRRLEERVITVGEKTYQTEEGAIRSVLADKNETLLFNMALETAMRLREMYTLKVGQIDLGARTIFLDKTKNGQKRQVPISSVLLPMLQVAIAGRSPDEELFPYWKDPLPQKSMLTELSEYRLMKESLNRATNKLSHLFSWRFSKAGCPELRFHDLRHEATSRIYERTSLTDLEVASITGHTNLRMLQRYANLRGSTLASRLW